MTAPWLLRSRIEQNIADHGLDYPWWIPMISGLGLTTCAVGALGLRHDLWPPGTLALMLVLVTVPGIVQVVVGRHFPHVIETIGVMVAAAVLLVHPVTGPGAFDCAPGLLALLTAEVLARDGIRNGLLTAGTGAVIILVAADRYHLHGLPVHLIDIVLGFAVGYMLLWQMRALQAERTQREGERVRATLAERQRIAREIHDLVAHSLSVTLLQIAGARHALRDVRSSEDVSDADAALADAERVGRQAMADIRQTVSALAEGPAETHALPTAADIGGLVAQMERAGLRVSYDEVGEPGRLAQATGLGLYRIAQESLANIAKHAPSAPATVSFTVTQTWARLSIRNPAGDGGDGDGAGSGLDGMRARADQLGATLVAGRDGSDWLVDLKVQLRERDGMLWCPRMVRRLAW
jgi:signal transduction histidine kinase